MRRIGQPVDEPGIAVERKDDRFVLGKQDVKFLVGETVRMFLLWLQGHQIDDVDNSDPKLRRVLAQQIDGSEGLQGRHIATTGHDYVRLSALIVTGPLPDTNAGRAVFDRLIHGEPLRRRLFPDDDHVDIVPAAQAVVCDAQQAVGIGRQINANDLCFLVDRVVDETGVLVRETIVILPPHMAGEQIVERCDGPAPRNVVADFEPLGVLIEHGVNEMDESFVTGKKP